MTDPLDPSHADPVLPAGPEPRVGPGRSLEPGGLTLGELLAALGFALVLVSSALAWAAQPFIESGGGVYPSAIPMPNLISAASAGTVPNVGLVVVALAVPGLILSMLRWRQTWVAALQVLLAALLVTVVVLFGLRWNSFFAGIEDATFLGSLRPGLYLAALGSLMALVASLVALMTARRASEPRGLGVLPEDLA
jgi:hypothetical protein